MSELFTAWSEELSTAGVPSPKYDARALAAHVLEVSPGELILQSGLDPDDVMRIDELVRRRATREPLQHIVGSVGFLGLDLLVGPGVFVPRPETELMAEHVVTYVLAGRGDHRPSRRSDHRLARGPDPRVGPGVRPDVVSGRSEAVSEYADAQERAPSAVERDGRTLVVDLCTGSGALGLAVAANVADIACVGVEASATAANYARRNSAAWCDRLAARNSSFEVVEADAISVASAELAHLRGKVDVVVCNPPYVPDDAIPREAEARDYDPTKALYGGPDGLDVVRQLVDTTAKLLRPGGLLAMEHADSQGEGAGEVGVPGLLRDRLWSPDDHCQPESAFQRIVDHLDLNGRPRFTTAIRSA